MYRPKLNSRQQRFQNFYNFETPSGATTTTMTTLQTTTTRSLICYEKELVSMDDMSKGVLHGNTM